MEPIPLRALNGRGINRFRSFLADLRRGSTANRPEELLTDPSLTREIEEAGSIEERRFAGRLDAVRYLHRILDPVQADTLFDDVGLWSWLSLFFLDQLAPRGREGRRRPGRDYRHILEPGMRNGIHHLLAGPVTAYRAYGDSAPLFLYGPLHRENRFLHEIGVRQALFSNRGIVEALHALYWQPRKKRPVPGMLSFRNAPATLQRFIAVLNQLEVNYDLYGMDCGQILQLLPDEFNRLKGFRRALLPLQRAGAPGERAEG